MPILLFAHIAFVFMSFALLWATDLLFWQAARRGDVAALLTVARYGGRLIPLGIAAFFIGIGFGVWNAVAGRWNLLAPWLLLAYGLVAVMLVLGLLIETPIFERMVRRAEQEANAPDPSPELRRMMADRRPIVLTAISWVLWIAVIFVMVVKPLT